MSNLILAYRKFSLKNLILLFLLNIKKVKITILLVFRVMLLIFRFLILAVYILRPN